MSATLRSATILRAEFEVKQRNADASHLAFITNAINVAHENACPFVDVPEFRLTAHVVNKLAALGYRITNEGRVSGVRCIEWVF